MVGTGKEQLNRFITKHKQMTQPTKLSEKLNGVIDELIWIKKKLCPRVTVGPTSCHRPSVE